MRDPQHVYQEKKIDMLSLYCILEKVRTCLESSEQWNGFAQRPVQSKKLLLLDYI